MFSDCIVSSAHRAAAAVAVQAQTTGVSLAGTRAHNLVAVITVAARTAGNVTVKAQDCTTQSGTYVDLGLSTAAISANGVSYLEFVNGVSPFLRFDLTPAGGFDGTVAIDLFADDTITPSSSTGT